ncbi:MAG TPA: LuxR C-terminal-related transcriptional regulator [Sedimentibacter sp.]|nr:LuxR C-terminal-related transcriptional regulator [Sedimentibacter sp.]
MQLILSGKSNREISGTFFISENTVKTHARNILNTMFQAGRNSSAPC